MIFAPIWLIFGLLTALPGRLEPVKEGELVVRVLTWNIDHIGGDVGAFARLLKAADADVICLQEASDRENYGFRQLNQLVREMPNYRLEIEGDNAILSRVPIKSKERLEIPIPHYRRFVPLVTISTPKGDLTVANIHLVQGFWPGWAMHPRGLPGMLRDMQRQRETQVEFTLKSLRTRPTSLILAGDFNLQPFGALQSRLDGELNDASADSIFASTFPTPTPMYRIDRVWTSSDLRPVKRSIIASGLSSHRPVVVDFVVR